MVKVDQKANRSAEELSVDFTIVGAGLAGLTLAKALADRGYQIVLLEQKAALDPKKTPPLFDQRAIVLSEVSCQILESMGFSDLLQGLTEIKQVHVSEKGTFSKLRFNDSDVNLPRLARVTKAFEFANRMVKTIEKNKAIQLFYEATIKDLKLDEQKIQFETPTGLYQVKSEVVIAADGAKSAIVPALGLTQTVQRYEQTALIANLSISHSHQSVAIERFCGDGILAFLPVAENEIAMVWCLPDEVAQHYRQLPESEFFNLLYKTFGHRFGYFTAMSQRHSHPLSANQVSSQCVERTMILGNAAHSLHPVAGQGFNLSIRDIAEFINSIEPLKQDFSNWTHCVESYLNVRHKGQQTMQRISDCLPRIFMNRYRAFKPLRSVALLLLDQIPILKRSLTTRFLGLSDQRSSIISKVLE